MCGNGARCFARFVQRLTGAQDQISFETGAGVIRARFNGDRVTVNMTEPKGLRLSEKIPLNSGTEFVADADKAMVQSIGAELRYHPHFSPKGTNVNFVQLLGPNSIRVRTYERGVEGETLACGTGVTAAALITARINRFDSPISVQVLGGDVLQVAFEEEQGVFRNVRLTGPADDVFQGEVDI